MPLFFILLLNSNFDCPNSKKIQFRQILHIIEFHLSISRDIFQCLVKAKATFSPGEKRAKKDVLRGFTRQYKCAMKIIHVRADAFGHQS